MLFRVGPLPAGALEAAAEFHTKMLPAIMELLDPPQDGEGDRPKGGGGGSPQAQRLDDSPLHPAASRRGPPPRAGEGLVVVFTSAPFDRRPWRLAAVQDLARVAAPVRVNAIAGDDEAAIAETLAFLEAAPGVTGQLLAVDGKSGEID